MVPNLLLRLPVDNVPLLNGPSERNLAKVLAFRLDVGRDVDFSAAVARDAVRDDAWFVFGRVVVVVVACCYEACFDGVRAIVKDQCS